MQIRRATLSDLPQLIALNRIVHAMHAEAYPELFRENPPDEAVAATFAQALASPSSCWLVAEDGEIAAFLNADFLLHVETWCAKQRHVCSIGGIIVLPAHRRRGVGRALLAELKREAEARGASRIELDVWSFNDEARRAFARLGFSSLREKMTLSADPGTGA